MDHKKDMCIDMRTRFDFHPGNCHFFMNAQKFHDPEEIAMEFPWNKWNKVSVDQKWNMCGTNYISEICKGLLVQNQ
jgi:hypothetical protein